MIDARRQATEQQLLEKIETLLKPVEQILRGEKPTQYPPALLQILSRMHDDHFELEVPDVYVTRHDEIPSEELNREKGKTRIHAIPANLKTRDENIRAVTSRENIRNWKILGYDPFYNLLGDTGQFDFGDPVDMAQDAAALVLTRSNLHGLRQFLHLLRAKMVKDGRTMTTRLIIQDTHNSYWSAMIGYLGLDRVAPAVMNDWDLHITHFPGAQERLSPDSTLHVLRGMGPRATAVPAPSKLDCEMKPGDSVFVCSGSFHKTVEFKSIMQAIKAKLHIQSFFEAVSSKPQEVLEDENSLTGNNWKKLLGIRNWIHANKKAAIAALCKGGKKPEDVWLIFDDRGREFKDQRIIRQTEAFKEARSSLKNMYPHKLLPGPDLATFLKNAGNKILYTQMMPWALAEIKGRTGQDADTTVMDSISYIAVRLDWMLMDDINAMPYVTSFAKTESKVVSEPRPDTPNPNSSDLFSAPMMPFNEENTPYNQLRTKAQIDSYTETGSEMALAVNALADVMGVTKHRDYKGEVKYAFGEEAQPKVLRIATQQTLFPEVKGHGTSNMSRAFKDQGYELMSGDDRQYDVTPFIRSEYAGSGPVRCDDTHREQMEQALMRPARLYRDADALVLTENNKQLNNKAGAKWLNMLLATSPAVGKLVGNMGMLARYTAILSDEKEKRSIWTPFKKLYQYMLGTSVFSTETALFDEKVSPVTLRWALAEHRKTYVRPTMVHKPLEMKPGSTEADSDLFRVTVYGSATLGNKTPAFAESLAFTERLAERGFALVQGGGSSVNDKGEQEGIMWAMAEGVHRFIRKFKAKHGMNADPRTHVRSEQCADTYEREGGFHPETQFGRSHELIEQRMAHLMNTDAEVVLAGGIGTIQEVAATMLMRSWGLVPTRHRPLVIVNQMVDGKRIYDPLIAMMSKEERRKLNIHIVNSCDEAVAILEHSRDNLSRVLEPGAIYVPEQAPLLDPHQGLRHALLNPS